MRALLLLLAVALVGCGTVANLTVDETEAAAQPFGGVRMDARVIGAMGVEPFWLCALCVIDTPLSLVADVLLLPYTLW